MRDAFIGAILGAVFAAVFNLLSLHRIASVLVLLFIMLMAGIAALIDSKRKRAPYA